MDAEELEYITGLLEADTKLRESLRDVATELEKKSRIMTGTMNKIHSTPTPEVPQLLKRIQPVLDSLKADIAQLAELIPQHQFWRWKDLWARHIQSVVFVIVLREFLQSGDLASLPKVSQELGIQEEWKDRLYLPAEDYLHGLISVINELARLAVNAVTMGNFELPSKISAYVKVLMEGFSLLNLKNDSLRKRFDSIKYDMKRIEEVVYDLSIRGLKKPQNESVGSGTVGTLDAIGVTGHQD